MGCYLRILGDFDPVELLADYKVDLQPDRTWRKGDDLRKNQKCETSGIQFFVSEASHYDYRGQFKQATFFLSVNKGWLRALTKDPRVKERFLDFGLSQDSHPAYWRRLPLPLIQWSGVCGVEIELAFYAISDKSEDMSNQPLNAEGSGIAEQGGGGNSAPLRASP